MPGFADLWEDDKLFHKSIALCVALNFSSADAIRKAGVDGIASHLNNTKVRFQRRTIERIVAWSGTAAEPSELEALYSLAQRDRDQRRFRREAGRRAPTEGWSADRSNTMRRHERSTDERGCILRDTKVMKLITRTDHSFVNATASCAEQPCWSPKT